MGQVRSVRALVVGAPPVEVEALAAAMRAAGFAPECLAVAGEREYLAALEARPDLVLAVVDAPGLPAPRALALLQDRGLPIPFVVLAGPEDDAAVELLHRGAADLLFRGHTGRLGAVVERALARRPVAAGEGVRVEGQVAALIDAAPLGVCVVDADGTFAQVNAPYAAMLGYRPEELLGQPLTAVVPPEAGAEAIAAFRRTLAGRAERVAERVLRREDGAVIAALAARVPVVGPDGRPQLVAFVVDIEERTRAEAALRARTDELETLLRVLPIGVGIAEDPAVADIRMNPAFARLLGLPPGANASLGAPAGERPTTFRVLRDGRELPVDELPFNVAAATGAEVRDLELEVVRADGVRRTELVNTAPLFDAQGRVRGVVGANLDITARVEAERQRDLLLAGMAHDLKNPLAALSWLAQTLRQQEGRMAAAERARLLEAFVQGTRQMTGQINALLDTVRLQLRRPLDLDLEEVDLAALVARVAAEVAPPGRAPAIRVEGAGEPLVGLCDAARLGRALANVLGNAAKYSPPDRAVVCTLSYEGAMGGWAVIRVADRGIGIPAAEVGRVFEPYFRASNTRGRAEGTGLGLAEVRQTAEAHGGSVELASAEGAGTTVTLRLPLRPPPGDQGASEAAARGDR